VIKVAALYVLEDGPYSNLPGVDVWGITKDARTYNGPHPVVAHPPCERWGRFAKINYARWGGEHNRPGNDAGCFASALNSVRNFNGVLEHPASSYAWAAHGLAPPGKFAWLYCGNDEWVCEVWQSVYGHSCNKKTWLFYCGDNKPQELDWSTQQGTHQIGFHDQRGKAKNRPTLSGKKASATPAKFRDLLISIARNEEMKA